MRWGLMVAIVMVLSQQVFAGDPTAWPQEMVDYYKVLRQEEVVATQELPAYKMYLRRGGKPYALLGDKFYHVGDEYASLTLVAINKKQVTLRNNSGVDVVVKIATAHQGVSNQEASSSEEPEEGDFQEGDEVGEEG